MSNTQGIVAAYLLQEHERIEWGNALRVGLLVVVLSLFAVLFVASHGALSGFGTRIEPVLFAEMIAVIDTVFFGLLYWRELKRTIRDNEKAFDKYDRVLDLPVWCFVAVMLLALALLGLSVPPLIEILRPHLPIPIDKATALSGVVQVGRGVYVTCVFLSFAVFAWCDYQFAFLVKDTLLTRQYWTLFAFGDFPTVVGAFFFAIFLSIGHVTGAKSPANSDALISGALIAQMLFADILVLTSSLNLHYCLLKWLCGNCGVSVRPSRGWKVRLAALARCIWVPVWSIARRGWSRAILRSSKVDKGHEIARFRLGGEPGHPGVSGINNEVLPGPEDPSHPANALPPGFE